MKSTLKTMTLSLFLVCLVCSAILACVYAVTKAPIDETNARLLRESISAVLPDGGTLSEALPIEVGGQPSEYYMLSENGAPKAYAVKSTVSGFGGPLVLMVGVTADGIVHNTSVFSHTETPGLGAKCTTDEKFISQWAGFDPSKKILKVSKDGGSVDAITASTITSRAYTLAVENALNAVKNLAGGQEND